jgi:molecular chaperone DnaJ
VLSDPERRRTYDAFGHEGLRTGGYQPRTEGFGSFQDIFDTFFGGGAAGGSPFGDIFGGGGPGGPADGGDVALAIEIELADVLTGVSREVDFEAVETCEHCRGNGAEPGTPIETCETCGGQGQVRQVSRTPFGQVMRTGACPTCRGSGKTAQTPCEVCDGEGRTLEGTEEVEVEPGSQHGDTVRLRGQGLPGLRSAARGDLHVALKVMTPVRLDDEQRELVERLEASLGPRNAPKAARAGLFERVRKAFR